MRSWIEVSSSRLQGNVAALRRHLRCGRPQGPLPEIMAVVKADAYGHGLSLVAPVLPEAGISRFGVAQMEEGLSLRRSAPEAEILVFGGVLPEEEEDFRQAGLTAACIDSRPIASGLRYQLKIDTGMTRLGIDVSRAEEMIGRLGSQLDGVFSHLGSAEDSEATARQLRRLLEATSGFDGPIHLSNSAGLAYPEAFLDVVRVGLALYGLSPGVAIDGLQPVLTWKTRILQVKTIPAGRGVGYSRTWMTSRPTRVGILPVGYADGYRRAFSNRASVEVKERLARVIGWVSMDLTAVDLTDIEEAATGDEVTLLSNDPESPLSAESLARLVGTIPYEVFTSIGRRAQRVLVD